MRIYELENKNLIEDLSRRTDVLAVRNEAFSQALAVSQEVDVSSEHVDTIGSAKRFIYEKSQDARESLEDDCERAMQEAMRANSWEYFEPLEHRFDSSSGEFLAYGLSIKQTLLNSLRVNMPEFERRRRIIEFIEEETYNYLARTGETDQWLLTISPCPEDEGSEALGYNPDKQKMMLRGVSFIEDGVSKKRRLEQLALSGYSRDTIEIFFKENKVDLPEDWSSEHILAKQLKISTKYAGVIDVAKRLDEIEGKNLTLNEDQRLDYEKVRAESSRRKNVLAEYHQDLVSFAVMLAESEISDREANQLFYKKVSDIIHEVCTLEPSYSVAAFDQATYEKYQFASTLESSGEIEHAQELRAEAKQSAPDISFCGIGGNSATQESGESFENKLCMDLTTCPRCSDYDVSGNEKSNGIKEKVYAIITEEHVRCNRCDAMLDKKTGKFIYNGRIFNRAQYKKKKLKNK